MCVCRLNYPVRNNHATCFIALSHPSREFETLHIFISHVPVSENDSEHKLCVLSYSEKLPIIFLILKIIQGDNINVHGSSFKVPVIFVRF